MSKSKQSKSERRQHKRFRFEILWEVKECADNIGTILDISKNGIRIWTAPDFCRQVGEDIFITIPFPSELKKAEIKICTRIVWIKTFKEGRKEMGLFFSKISDENLDMLNKLIDYIDAKSK